MTRHLCWLLPLIALVLFAPFSTAIDLNTSGFFYRGDEFTVNGFTQLMYRWGNLPGQLVGGCAVLVWLATCCTARWQRWRKASAAIALTFLIGPGLLVNGAFKELWGRPRPREVVQFGGKQEFRPFYKPLFHRVGFGNKSFPSGHVSMGFFFFILALVGRREGMPWLTYLAYYLAFQLGLLLALARIAQGGHFVSDCLCAAILMWWVSLACCRLVYGPCCTKEPAIA